MCEAAPRQDGGGVARRGVDEAEGVTLRPDPATALLDTADLGTSFAQHEPLPVWEPFLLHEQAPLWAVLVS